MIDLPSLPTDSIYKFCALSGIVICLTAVYLFFKLRSTYLEKYYDCSLLLQEIGAEIKYFKQKEKSSPEDILKLRIKHEISIVRADELKGLSKQLILITIVSAVLMVTGLLTAMYGFHKWYTKVQIYQDMVLENQARALEINFQQAGPGYPSQGAGSPDP